MPNTIADNLQRLTAARTAIGNAIVTKGGTVNSGDGLEEFPADIMSIKNDLTSIDITENGTYYGGEETVVTSSTFPVVVNDSNGTPIRHVDINGNKTQNGTPTPDNPVDVNGVGEIDNIFEGNIEQGGYSSGNPYTAQNRVRSDTMILVQPNVHYYMNFTGLADQFTIIQYTTNGTYSKDIGSYLNAGDPFVFSSAWKLKFVFRNSGNTNISPSDVSNITLSRGYKIPISSAIRQTISKIHIIINISP